MPQYVFECQHEGCNLRFEKSLKMGDYTTYECPNCRDQAPRIVEGFAFGFKDTPGAPPGNTGVHKEDYPTADHIVGKDADKRWAQHKERDAVKNQVRQVSTTHALTRRTAKDGSYVEYEGLSEVGRQILRTTAHKAIAALREQKAPPGNR